ncbi:MAG TPA: hypothetical protein VFB14_21025 [Bryobacteraceae bacterium]|jgi:hypothetical protein|nr:hypothetical protein [Bryobacteraceae bacterium]
MKKLVLASFLTVSLCSVGAFAEEMTGYISDAHCGANHNSVSAKNTQCIQACLKKGSDPVLVSNGKVMKFDSESAAKAKEYAGDNVKIDGTMDGDMIKINSISKAE